MEKLCNGICCCACCAEEGEEVLVRKAQLRLPTLNQKLPRRKLNYVFASSRLRSKQHGICSAT